MFKKIKDKLAEEMKQSPARLQASMQQLAQVVSPALSSASIQDLSVSNDNFSLTEETDTETPRNSPAKHEFKSVNLNASSENSKGTSRRSSISSVNSDASSFFPSYESPANSYHIQSDMDQSASEVDDNITPQLDNVTKDQLYLAYRNVQAKHKKYREKYRELASHYRAIQRNETKLENILVETQDKALKRIDHLKEQCHLEQQAKAHLEDMLRNDIEEKQCLINTLNTKIALLKKNGVNGENTDNCNSEPLLIDLTNDTPGSQHEELIAENNQLKNKSSMLENLVSKFKTTLKDTKYELARTTEEKLILERKYNTLNDQLEETKTQVKQLTDEVSFLKTREEEAAISLAQNKLDIYRELEGKEEQIKKLTQDLEASIKTRESQNEKYRSELEQLKLSSKNECDDAINRCIEEQRRNEELSKKLEKLEQLLSTEKEKAMQEPSVIEKLNNKFEENNAELIVLRSKNEKLLELFEKEKLEKEHLQAKCEELQKSIEFLNNEISQSQDRLSEREQVLMKTSSELAQLTSEHSSCKHIADELKTKIYEIRENVSQLVEEKETQSKKVKDCRNRLQMLRKECTELVEHTKIVIEDKRREMSNLKEQLSNVVLRFGNKLNETKNDSEELCRLRAQNEKQSKKCENLKKEWEIRTAQVHQLMLLVDDLEVKQKKLLDDNKMLRTTLQSNNMHWLEIEEDYKNKLKKQEEEGSMLSRKVSEMAAELAAGNEQISRLRYDLRTSMNLPSTIKQTKQGNKGKNKNESHPNYEDFQQVIEKLNVRVADLEKENLKMKVDNATLNENLNVTTKEKTKLIEENRRQTDIQVKLKELHRFQNETIASLESKIQDILKDKYDELKSNINPHESMENLDIKAQQHCMKTSKKLEELRISENKKCLTDKMSVDNVDLVVSKKIQNLLLDKEAVEAENLVLKQKEKELKLMNAEFERTKKMQVEMISNLECKLYQVDSSKAEVDKRVEELMCVNGEMIAENKILKDKQNELMQRIESLQQLNQLQKDRISDLTNKLQYLESDRNDSRRLNSDMQTQLQTLEQTNQSLKETISKWENKILSLESEIINCKHSNNEYEILVQALQLEKEQSEIRISTLEVINNQFAQMQQQLLEGQEHLNQRNADMRRLNDTVSTFQNNIIRLQKDYDNTKRSLEEQLKVNELLSNENKVLSNKQTEMIKEKQCSQICEDKIVFDLKQEIQNLQSKKSESDNRYSEQVKISEDLSLEMGVLSNEKECLLKKVQTLEENHMKFEKYKAIFDEEKEELSRNHEKQKLALKEMYENCLSEFEQRCADLNAANADIVIQKSQIEKLELAITELIKEKDNVDNKLKEVEIVNNNYQETITSLTCTVDELRSKLQDYEQSQLMVNSLNDKHKEILVQNNLLSEECNSMKLKYEEKLGQVELELNNLYIENSNLQKSVTNLSTEVKVAEELKKIVDELKTQLGKKSDEVMGLQGTNKDLLNRLQEMNEKTNNLILELDKLKENEVQKVGQDAILKEMNGKLQEELQINKDKNKQLEAQLDETLITFQTKESQIRKVNVELTKEVEELKNEISVNNEEQSMRLKQLAKEFQAQLHDKDEELQAALEKRFDQQQSYESELIRQYKEQLKDFQVELTTKSEQIENLILENKQNLESKQVEANKLTESIDLLKKNHESELKEAERKWKTILEQTTVHLEAKHEQEINELTNEWQHERKTQVSTEISPEELENTSRVAMAAVQSNTGSFHTLQQTLLSQKRELTELRKLVKLRHETLEDSTEIEYLRNILYEYMMGKETLVLAKVIAAVVKFDHEQTSKIIKKEEDKLTLLGSLGLS